MGAIKLFQRGGGDIGAIVARRLDAGLWDRCFRFSSADPHIVEHHAVPLDVRTFDGDA